MNPVAFRLFGIDVMWYGVIISFAIFIATLIAIKEANRVGLGEDNLIDMLLIAIPLSIIGARIYYVIFSFDEYRDNLLGVFNFRNGGLAIHGAIIVAALVAYIFAKKKKLNFWVIVDVCAPSLVLGQAIGRWGNYINQEAHGGETTLPWGIMVEGVKVHPTFLYESVGNILIFLFLIWFRKNKQKESGEIFTLYLVLYSIVRFIVEGFRTDSLMIGPLRMAQVISLTLVVIGIIFFIKIRNGNVKKIDL